MLTRREALKLTAAGLATFVLPAKRPHIDLMQFCDKPGIERRFDLTLPWELDDWTYATDEHICVRVRPELGDAGQREGRIPPFGSLSWNHAALRKNLKGWRPLPRVDPLLCDNMSCPSCEGTGNVAGEIPAECEVCGGTGSEWVGYEYHISHPVTCRYCKGKGCFQPAEECPDCKGDAIGVFPAVARLDGTYFDVRLYEKARSLGSEFIHDNWNCMPHVPMIRFVFDGGEGLLMGMEKSAVERNLI